MNGKKEINLDPVIKEIDIQKGCHYKHCKARVVFDVSDGNGGRTDITVVYPVQEDRHLIMLMEEQEEGTNTTKRIGFPEMHSLSTALKDALGKGD